MRAIRAVVMLAVLGVVGVLAYNYWSGYGWTLQPPTTSGGVDAEKARTTGAELAAKATTGIKAAAEKTNEVVGEASLTAKIKSKMALDDYVKARTIDVDSNGSTVTLTGTVGSAKERERAVQLARETAGVSQVIDHLQIAK